MVSGTFILTDTMKKAFDDLFQGTYKNAGAVISGKEIVKGAPAASRRCPSRCRRRCGAAGRQERLRGDLRHQRHQRLRQADRPQRQAARERPAARTSAGASSLAQKANPTTLKSGKWAVGPNQVVIDAASAKKGHYKLGDKIGVAAEGPQRSMTVSGIARFGIGRLDRRRDVRRLRRADGAEAAAQGGPVRRHLRDAEVGRLAGRGRRPGQAAAAGVGADRDRRRGRQGRGRQEVNDGLAFFQYLLLAFAGIALLVGSFVIFNTLSMTVAQRVRELATLRTLGASRKQVFRSVLLEGFITGLFAADRRAARSAC